ncbi:hypothetical protein PIB30_105094, partial [Stylosanthes scabra]|nr:hypothetical protein [Stylosanthes scabra]
AGHIWRKGSSHLVCENGAKRDLLGMELVTFGGASGSRLDAKRDGLKANLDAPSVVGHI